jgi:uncharacterized protein (UPF0332 family)
MESLPLGGTTSSPAMTYPRKLLAKELAEPEEELNHRDKEARQRSAVSRAYYAIFLTARDVFDPEHRSRPLRELSGSYHSWLWKKLKTDRDREDYRYIGEHAKALRESRIQADYGDFIFNLQSFVADAIDNAEDLKDRLEPFLASRS